MCCIVTCRSCVTLTYVVSILRRTVLLLTNCFFALESKLGTLIFVHTHDHAMTSRSNRIKTRVAKQELSTFAAPKMNFCILSYYYCYYVSLLWHTIAMSFVIRAVLQWLPIQFHTKALVIGIVHVMRHHDTYSAWLEITSTFLWYFRYLRETETSDDFGRWKYWKWFWILQCNLCLHLKVSQRRRASARACVRRAENGPPGAFAICWHVSSIVKRKHVYRCPSSRAFDHLTALNKPMERWSACW